jgi:tetratricopeptide (TPR) repeat protein
MHHIEERWFMEGFYHAVLAEEKDLTRSILIEHGENLALSFPAEIRDLLAIASRWYVRTELEVEALSTMALAQEELKQDKAALETYERLLTILEGREGIEAAPLLQRKARLQVSSQLWDQAFESHDRALRLYQSSGDRSGEARELLSLGSAYRRKGEGAKAKQAILESLSISKEMEDSAGEATALNNLGLQEWDEGGISRAEELLETAAAKAHQASDAYGEANALENLAMILKEQYKYEGAVNRLADAAAAFLRAGDRLECKRATASRAELLGEMGKSEEGIEICRKTIVDQSLMQPGRFMMRAGLDRGHADLQRALVHLLRDEGRLREAATEAERLEGMIGSIGDKRLLAKSMVERAEILEEVGDEREALLVLERAGSDLQKQGDAEGLAVVHMRAASIRRRAGDHGRSRSELDEALRQSVISGNELLEGVVLEELGTSLPKGDERRGTLQKAMETYNRLRRREDAERVRQLMEE